MSTRSTSAGAYTDFQGLAELRGQARKDPAANLKKVASQFEAIFIQNLLKTARAAQLSPGLLDGPQADTYWDMYNQQLSLTLSKGKGIGIAEMLVRQLQASLQNLPPEPVSPTQTTSSALQQTSGASSLKPKAEASKDPPKTPEEFVAQVWPAAQKAAAELGVDPAVLVAQSAVESGWGRSVARLSSGESSHNLFGIKADSRWEGKRVTVSTLEYESGVMARRQDPFRAYDSFEESFQDYSSFLRSNPRYRNALMQAGDPDAFLRGLQAAGYATDPAYAKKVSSVLHGKSLRDALSGGS